MLIIFWKIDPVFRMMKGLKCSKKAVVGPWGHQWPDSAHPVNFYSQNCFFFSFKFFKGPTIGYLQLCLKWLDYHFKGKDTGIQNEPSFCCFVVEPSLHDIPERPGKWLYFSEDALNESSPKDLLFSFNSNFQLFPINSIPSSSINPSSPSLFHSSPLSCGIASGDWLSWGDPNAGDLPSDQRIGLFSFSFQKSTHIFD